MTWSVTDLDMIGRSIASDFSPTPMPASRAIRRDSAPAASRKTPNCIGCTWPAAVRTWTRSSRSRCSTTPAPDPTRSVHQLNPTTSPVTNDTPHDASLALTAAISSVGSNQPSLSRPARSPSHRHKAAPRPTLPQIDIIIGVSE